MSFSEIKDALTGAEILGKDGSSISLDSVMENDLIGLYFSAHWCPPCRGFTPKLAEVYNQLQAADKKVEIIFLSSDQDQQSFDSYYQDMPWLALNYEARSTKEGLSDLLDVEGIPTLVLMDPKTGAVNKSGRQAVMAGVDYFPWSPELMAKADSERDEREAKARADARAQITAVFANWSCLGDSADTTALREAKAVVALVGSASVVSSCKYVVPELKHACDALGTQVGVVYLPTESGSADEAFEQGMPDSWIKLNTQDAKTVLDQLPSRGTVHAYVLSGDGGSCISTNAAMEIYRNRESNFPWDEEVMKRKEKEERVVCIEK